MSLLLNINKHDSNAGNQGMSLIDHVEALRWHLVRSLVAVILMSLVAYINIEWIFTHIILAPADKGFVAYRWFAQLGALLGTNSLDMQHFELEFQNTALPGQFMISISVALVGGFVLAFPYVVWEVWRFIRPALRQGEIRRAGGFVFWLSLLFIAGVTFAYFVITPFTIGFFATYQLSPQFHNIITIDNYYSMVTDLALGMGIVFELPVVVYFLSCMGILTPALMKQYSKFAIVIILVISAVITPPDWLSIWLVAAPLIVLYNLSIYISFKVMKNKSVQ